MGSALLRRVLSVVVLVCGTGLLASCLPPALPPAGQTWVGWQYTPIKGYSELSPQQLADYVRVIYFFNGGINGCGTKYPYRATVDVDALAWHYVDEGNAHYVRGDLAFVQAALETGWFSFPDCGQVKFWYNNFAGIGATDANNPATVGQWPTAQLGVRAQIQRLNRYSDPNPSWTVGRPLVAQRGWPGPNVPAQYDSFFIKGTKPTVQSLTGTWATSPCYDTRIMKIYNDMRAWYGLGPYPVAPAPGC